MDAMEIIRTTFKNIINIKLDDPAIQGNWIALLN